MVHCYRRTHTHTHTHTQTDATENITSSTDAGGEKSAIDKSITFIAWKQVTLHGNQIISNDI